MKSANQKEALNLNNKENFITPYTLGLVLQSPNTGGGYRIGDVLITVNEENPSEVFGGKWELLCPGRTLVCVDTSQTEFNTVRKTGGSKYLQQHIHYFRAVKDVVSNSGSALPKGADASGRNTGLSEYVAGTVRPVGDVANVTTGNSGNLQPFMAVFMWVRVS